MEAESIKCPDCGSSLKYDGRSEYIKCEYCGNTLRIRQRNVNTDGSITVTDSATGLRIGTVRLPFGFPAKGMLLPNLSSYTYPFGVNVMAQNDKNVLLSYFIGEAFCDRSRCPSLSGMYSEGVNRISRTKFRNFCEVRDYVDVYASGFASGVKASGLRFVEERSMPLYEPLNEEEAMENYKRKIGFEKMRAGSANMAQDLDYYLKGVCRVYDITVQNQEYRFALATIVCAWKYQVAGMGGGVGLMEIGSLLDNAFSGLFKKQKPPEPVAKGFGDMPMNSVIDWGSDGLFLLQCPPEEFDAAFAGAFTDFCSTLRLDDGIRERMFDQQTQILQEIARYSQQQINQMNWQFQSWQQVHATQQSAFDAYNNAWWARNNAADAARRARSQSMMSGGSGGHGSFSEAMRGVNTYERLDGTEVEVSVAFDRAYTNHQGDVRGSNSAFEPGGDWTELNRK